MTTRDDAIQWDYNRRVSVKSTIFSYFLNNMKCDLGLVDATNCVLPIQEEEWGFWIKKHQRDGVDNVTRKKVIFFSKFCFDSIHVIYAIIFFWSKMFQSFFSHLPFTTSHHFPYLLLPSLKLPHPHSKVLVVAHLKATTLKH